MDPRKPQRETLDDLADMAELGRGTFEEFLSGRRVVEEVGNFDHRPRRRRGLPLALDRAAFQADLSAAGRARGGGHQPHARNRGDAGKRFAAKAQCADREEIGVSPDLAGGVAKKRTGRIRLGHAFAVIRHTYVPPPGLSHLHRDPARTRVNSVLDQFFHCGGRPLDNFTRCNSVRDLERQDRDL